MAVVILCAPSCHEGPPPDARASPGASAVTSAAAPAVGSEALPAPAPSEELPAPIASAETAGPAAGDDQKVSMNLEAAPAAAVLEALGNLIHRKVNVDPAARALVGCSVVSVRLEQAVTRRQAVAHASAALRAKGLVLLDTGSSLEVKRAPDAPRCPRAR